MLKSPVGQRTIVRASQYRGPTLEIGRHGLRSRSSQHPDSAVNEPHSCQQQQNRCPIGSPSEHGDQSEKQAEQYPTHRLFENLTLGTRFGIQHLRSRVLLDGNLVVKLHIDENDGWRLNTWQDYRLAVIDLLKAVRSGVDEWNRFHQLLGKRRANHVPLR